MLFRSGQMGHVLIHRTGRLLVAILLVLQIRWLVETTAHLLLILLRTDEFIANLQLHLPLTRAVSVATEFLR